MSDPKTIKPTRKVTLEDVRQELLSGTISPELEWNMPGILLGVLSMWDKMAPGALGEAEFAMDLNVQPTRIIKPIAQ